MPRVITSTDLQKKTREMIDYTRTRGEPVVIETYGKPMAAILSYDEYQAYQQYKQGPCRSLCPLAGGSRPQCGR
jgi:prevent-host-death family protein